MSRRELAGRRFGRLVALEPTDKRYRTSVVWRCRCDCGRECEAPSSLLLRGTIRSCGCLQDENRRADVTGQRRGHLVALRPTDQRRGGSTVWLWRCDCGREVLKALELVHDTALCPECARALKSRQARAMYEGAAREDEHGLLPSYLDGLRAGKLASNNTSGVRGVTWHAATRKWRARMQRDGRTVTIGCYDTIEDAAKARAEAVARQYGGKDDPKNE